MASEPGRAPAREKARTTPQVLLAYAAFIVIGISAGVAGVAIPAQMADYDVDRTTIGITFFTFSAGFLVAGFTAGHVIQRAGLRLTLLLSSGLFAVTAVVTATRPSFAILLLLGLPAGYASGMLESALNTELAGLPGAGTLLNRLHAFFGVGALIGPVLAARLLLHFSWTSIWVALAVASVPLLVGFAVLHVDAVRQPPDAVPDGLPSVAEGLPAAPEDWPATTAQPGAAQPGAAQPGAAQPEGPQSAAAPTRGLLRSTLRQPGVLLAAAMLVAYVGLEIGVGTWAYSALVDREIAAVTAGLLVSGYWLGLTLGRLVIEPLAARIGWALERTMMVCVVGVTLAFVVIWLFPTTFVAAVGLAVAGFFLGPIFPGIMVATPRITVAARVATAIGVLNGVSVLGGSVLPWLAGFLAEHIALWTLWPYAIALGLAQLVLWRLLTPRMAAAPDAAGDAAGGAPGGAVEHGGGNPAPGPA